MQTNGRRFPGASCAQLGRQHNCNKMRVGIDTFPRQHTVGYKYFHIRMPGNDRRHRSTTVKVNLGVPSPGRGTCRSVAASCCSGTQRHRCEHAAQREKTLTSGHVVVFTIIIICIMSVFAAVGAGAAAACMTTVCGAGAGAETAGAGAETGAAGAPMLFPHPVQNAAPCGTDVPARAIFVVHNFQLLCKRWAELWYRSWCRTVLAPVMPADAEPGRPAHPAGCASTAPCAVPFGARGAAGPQLWR